MDSSAPERSAPSADASPSLWKHLARFWRDRPGEAKVLLGMSAAFLQLEKVTDVNAIIDAGIMRTPALAVDDDILIEGKVPSSDELQQLLG